MLALVAAWAALIISHHSVASYIYVCEKNVDPDDCCVPGDFNLSMASTEDVRPGPERVLPGVEFLEMHPNTNLAHRACSHSGLFRVHFQPVGNDTGSCSDCLAGPTCGRRMLRLDMDIADFRWFPGWVMEIGEVANGSSADTGVPNTRLVATGEYVSVRMSSHCFPHRYHIPLSRAWPTRRLSIFLSHGHLRVVSGTRHLDLPLCSPCLFQLEGKRQGQVVMDTTLYIGVNQSVDRPLNQQHRGHGICSVRLSWMCPWCTDM